MTGVNVRARALQGFSATVRELGGDPGEVWHAAGLSSSDFDDPEAWIPFESVLDAYEKASSSADCPHFGMRLASSRGLSYLGPLILIFKYSATLEDAIHAVAKYSAIQNSGYTISLLADSDIATLRFCIAGGLRSRANQWVEESLLTMLAAFQLFLDGSFEARGIRFAHKALSDSTQYQQFFGVNPEFDAGEDALLFDVVALSLPNPRTDADMVRFLDGYLGTRVATTCTTDIASTVRALLADLIPSGSYSIDVVADLLNIHRRTLQRRLANEGVRYVDLLDRCRAEMALEYLEGNTQSIVNLAHLLGYSDQSAFNHAFRRWHGKSPSAWAASNRKLAQIDVGQS